jgi:hypothetical protein
MYTFSVNSTCMNIAIFKKIFNYFKKIWFLWLLSLIFNIITFFVILFKIKPAGKNLALHYNVLVGVEQYGSGHNLYFIPVIGVILGIMNLALYKLLRDDENLISFLSAFVTLGVQGILLAAIVFLATVN